MARPKSLTATIKDIAREARVSPSTVSRVLNNPDYDVSDGLRERVRSAAGQLGYHPATHTREPRIRSRLGVILPNLINPMYAQALTGVETIARDYDYGVSVGISLRDPEREYDYLSELFHRKIMSVILSPVTNRVEGLKDFIGRGMRVVLLDQRLPDVDCPRIDYDLRGGVQKAVSHLASLGHDRIGLVTLPLTRWNREEVRLGYVEAMARLGQCDEGARVFITSREPTACGPGGDYAAGIEIGDHIATMIPDVSALVVLNGSLACGLLAGLRSRGIRVPEQLSVVSLEDVPGGELFEPALTAVQLPAFAVGQMAATLLVSKLGSENPSLQRRHVQAELVVRGSTCPPA